MDEEGPLLLSQPYSRTTRGPVDEYSLFYQNGEYGSTTEPEEKGTTEDVEGEKVEGLRMGTNPGRTQNEGDLRVRTKGRDVRHGK